ncbi:MAG: class I SAM-dependent methyltransferase [Acidimicrobiia bacterium]|nr:MAG: class I SAM-dependent methyltransferase [Acidimicrobiia bacterium]
MPEDTKDAYRRVARFYDRLLEPVNAPLRAIGLKLFPPDESMRVLDVGCGTGAHLEAYVESGATCSGIDLSPAMLEQARSRLGDRAELRVGDAAALPYDEASFDLVFTSLFLHELDDATRTGVLSEMARVVRPDGRILVIDYRTGSLRTKGRVTRAISTVAERIAGRDHYRNWRTYLRSGGIPAMISGIGLDIDREKIVAGGNLALWLLRADR